MSLTDASIRSARPQAKPAKLFDGGGLFLLVTPAGGKWWRLKYYFEGKEKLLSLGVYPAVGLKEARRRRDEAKEQIAQGIDPSLAKQAAKVTARLEQADSYELIAREWHSKYSAAWAESTRLKSISRQEKYIFPLIGGKSIRAITAPEVLEALRRIEARGSLYTAHRTMQDCSRIFRYAIATGRAERDTAADLRGALAPAQKTNFSTIIDKKKIGELLRAVDGYGENGGNIITACALRLAPLVFVRPGELRKAEWSEFDIESAEWRIPAHKMKMRQQHIVPLSRQAISIVEEIRQYTGGSQYLFPSPRSFSRPLSDVALLAALRRMGFVTGEMTIHGFRAMASTTLNELGYNRDWIERQLAHGERNSIRAAYNYAEYLPERRRMMAEWADYLDGLREQS